jgi:hypothetical protein
MILILVEGKTESDDLIAADPAPMPRAQEPRLTFRRWLENSLKEAIGIEVPLLLENLKGNQRLAKWLAFSETLADSATQVRHVFILTDLYHNPFGEPTAAGLRQRISAEQASRIPLPVHAHVIVQEFEAIYFSVPSIAADLLRLPADHRLFQLNPEDINGENGVWKNIIAACRTTEGARSPNHLKLARQFIQRLRVQDVCARCPNFKLFWDDLVRVARELQQQEGGASA